MQINVLLFGQLADFVGANNLVLNNITDTNSLVTTLFKTYPALANTTYLISVNKKVATENTPLTPDTTVALLPPFSGG